MRNPRDISMTARQHAYHGIPNEIVAAWLIESIYAAGRLAQARRPAAITLPMGDYHEIPAHIAADALERGRK